MTSTRPELAASSIAEQLGAPAAKSAPERRAAYRRSAAVLASFDPTRLRPFPDNPDWDRRAVEDLASDSLVSRTDDPEQPRWLLREEVRIEALKELADRSQMKAALEANPDRLGDPIQKLFEACVAGTPLPLEDQNVEELTRTLQIVRWLGPVLDGIPRPEEVRRRLERERFLDSFRPLVEHFQGRTAELDTLRRYVGVVRSSSLVKDFFHAVLDVISLEATPPLLVHGPGGIGKSTLLAKFILEHAESQERERFPFIYLDFDQAGLLVEQPLTLLIEALRQLEVQYPHAQDSIERARRSWLEGLSRRQEVSDLTDQAGSALSSTSPPRGGRRSRRDRAGSMAPVLTDAELERCVAEFAQILREVAGNNRPALFVLDTFEEAQYHSREQLEQLWTMAKLLQSRFNKLRLVLAGRAQVAGWKLSTLPLEGLDRDAAIGFLASLGVHDRKLAGDLAAKFGGHPLSLKLAAAVVKNSRENFSELQSVQTHQYLLFSVSETVIQRQLYRRMLDHLHDPEVRKLVHPGFVLRTITPELILEVLNKPCDLKLTSLEDASRLFHTLAREKAFVEESGEGLRPLPEVRRIMLGLLTQDAPDAARRIHERAVAYYEARDRGPVDRTEELYHRLALEQPRSVIESRWLPEAETPLRDAVDELPERSKIYLATKIDWHATEELLEKAELADWERHMERRARRLLERQKPDDAWALLGKRSERSETSPLPALEVEVLEQLGRRSEARARVDTAAACLSAAGDRGGLLRLHLVAARLARADGDMTQTGAYLRLAAELAAQSGDQVRLAQALLEWLRLYQAGDVGVAPDPGGIDSHAGLTAQLYQVGRDLIRKGSQKISPLLWSIAGELGGTYPDLVSGLLKRFGFDLTEPRKVDRIARELANEDARLSAQRKEEPGALARVAGVPAATTDLKSNWSDYLRTETPRAVGKSIAWLIENHLLVAGASYAIANVMKEPRKQ